MKNKNWFAFIALLLTSISSFALGSGVLDSWAKASTPQFIFGLLGVVGAAFGQFYTKSPRTTSKKGSRVAVGILALSLFSLGTMNCAGTTAKLSSVVAKVPSVETQYNTALDLYVSAMTEVNRAYANEPKPVTKEVQENYDKVIAKAREFKDFKEKAKKALALKDSLAAQFWIAEMSKVIADIEGKEK